MILEKPTEVMTVRSEKFFQQERQMWLETLSYIQQGIVVLKNILAEVVKNGIIGEPLETIENFQNQFLNKDAVITLLRRDVSLQNSAKNESDGKYTTQQKKLRQDMQKMEEDFSHLKLNFSNYLCQII